ncbi:MAG: GNA1162 family protein [Gammaproteobacteria bacterium]
MARSALLPLVVLALALTGCVTSQPYDYSAYRLHPPRSILVVPPLNESTTVEGTYGYLSTVSRPLAELGYYVFPVAVVDQFFKENGLPTAGEMHQVPLNKLVELTGADAVLFPTLIEYGSKFQLVSTTAIVRVKASLVDTRTGTLLWEGTGMAQQGSNGSGSLLADLVAAAVTQAINTGTDAAHNVSRAANANLFYAPGRGLPYGPYSPKSGQAP